MRGLLLPSGTYAHTRQETLWRIRSPSAEQKAETFIPSLPGAFISSPSAPDWASSQGVRTTQRTGPGCVSGESQHTRPPSTPNADEMYLTKIAPAGDLAWCQKTWVESQLCIAYIPLDLKPPPNSSPSSPSSMPFYLHSQVWDATGKSSWNSLKKSNSINGGWLLLPCLIWTWTISLTWSRIKSSSLWAMGTQKYVLWLTGHFVFRLLCEHYKVPFKSPDVCFLWRNQRLLPC